MKLLEFHRSQLMQRVVTAPVMAMAKIDSLPVVGSLRQSARSGVCRFNAPITSADSARVTPHEAQESCVRLRLAPSIDVPRIKPVGDIQGFRDSIFGVAQWRNTVALDTWRLLKVCSLPNPKTTAAATAYSAITTKRSLIYLPSCL
ncbi:MAG: hypothetical protein WDO73_02845 [Ignavibacteriota bacterium]